MENIIVHLYAIDVRIGLRCSILVCQNATPSLRFQQRVTIIKKDIYKRNMKVFVSGHTMVRVMA